MLLNIDNSFIDHSIYSLFHTNMPESTDLFSVNLVLIFGESIMTWLVGIKIECRKSSGNCKTFCSVSNTQMTQSSSHESTSKAPQNSPKVWELLIASQAKPFPYSPLAAAIYINNAYKQKGEVPPIVIAAQPVVNFNPGASTAQLIKKE